jgi:hypothetical protein
LFARVLIFLETMVMMAQLKIFDGLHFRVSMSIPSSKRQKLIEILRKGAASIVDVDDADNTVPPPQQSEKSHSNRCYIFDSFEGVSDFVQHSFNQ